MQHRKIKAVLGLLTFVGGIAILPLPIAKAQAAPTSQPALGQGPGAQQMQKVKAILDGLDLSDDQKGQIRTILEDARTQGQQLRQDLADAGPKEKAEKLKAFFGQIKDKIDAVLTPDQKTSFDSQLAQLRGGQAAAGRNNMVERLNTALDQMQLTDDQRTKVKQFLEEARKSAADLRNQTTPADRQEKMRGLLEKLRDDLSTVLTPAQLQELRDKMQQSAQAGARQASANPPATQPVADATNNPTNTDAGGQMMADGNMTAANMTATAGGNATAAGTGAAASLQPASDTGKLIAVGQAAPNFRLSTVDDSAIQLTKYKGKVVVLVFGSYTSPVFRDRAVGIEQLYRDLDGKAIMMVIYTREAHPAGGWEVPRNKIDHVSIKAPTTDDQRLADARGTQQALHLTMPVLVDDLQDSTADAYGVTTDAAVVIGTDGKITATQHWAEASALKHMIDEATTKTVAKAE